MKTKLIIIKVDKEMTTDECIEHARKLSKQLKMKVLVIDNKVLGVDLINITQTVQSTNEGE